MPFDAGAFPFPFAMFTRRSPKTELMTEQRRRNRIDNVLATQSQRLGRTKNVYSVVEAQ